jgi:predicted tellurium resistance membrane protein TerC
MTRTITLPIKCSTVKTLYQVLSEVATYVGLILPFVGISLLVASWYRFTYIAPPVFTRYGIDYENIAVIFGVVGVIFTFIGVAAFTYIVTEKYNFSCIKDEETP